MWASWQHKGKLPLARFKVACWHFHHSYYCVHRDFAQVLFKISLRREIYNYLAVLQLYQDCLSGISLLITNFAKVKFRCVGLLSSNEEQVRRDRRQTGLSANSQLVYIMMSCAMYYRSNATRQGTKLHTKRKSTKLYSSLSLSKSLQLFFSVNMQSNKTLCFFCRQRNSRHAYTSIDTIPSKCLYKLSVLPNERSTTQYWRKHSSCTHAT